MNDRAPLVFEPGPPADFAEGSLYFIGNATTLIRYAGFTLLTDPTFIHKHQQTWLGWGLHTTRLTDPACEIADLPPLDGIVLSHFHGDHFDQAAEEGLDRDLPIVTPPQAAKDLTERGFRNTVGVPLWGTQRLVKGDAEAALTALPARHGPLMVDFALPDVMGSLLAFGRVGEPPLMRLYISGDTIIIHELKEIPIRYPDIDLGLLHLGGTRVLGVMVTMDADQGVECLRVVNPRRAIPIHFDDYDVFTSPLSDFRAAVAAAGMADRITWLNRGDTATFAPRAAPPIARAVEAAAGPPP